MDWSMADEHVKVELFRFVDVLPMLKTSEQITEHLHEYLSEVKHRLPSAMGVALGLAKRTPGVRGAVAKAARLAASDFARRFIAGSNVKEVLAAAKKQRELKRCFTLDILGEAVISEREADDYFRAYCELLDRISPTVNTWPEVPQIDRGVAGPLPRMNLSIKLSALDSHFDAIDPAGTTKRVGGAAARTVAHRQGRKAFINVDMESYEKKDLTLHIFRTVLSEPEFRDVRDVGIVIQCYLRDADRDLVDAARLGGAARHAGVGAARERGLLGSRNDARPAITVGRFRSIKQKWQSDATFERATRFRAAKPPASAAGDRQPQRAARSPTRSPRPRCSACRSAASNCKCSTAWPTPRRRRSSNAAIACGSTCPTAN